MDSILVIGSNTLVGANLATRWAQDNPRISRLTWAEAEDVSGPSGLEAARGHVRAARPSRVVYCGPAAVPAWSGPVVDTASDARLRLWCRAIREADCRLTYLSSDAVFTGPWLFHVEDGTHHCHSPEASRLRAMEELVLRVVPEALVVRTNAFGWSADGSGWLENLLDKLETGNVQTDPARHATPVLATDLADIVARAHEESTTGLLHVGGAERVSHDMFVRRLADRFNLPTPRETWEGRLAGPVAGFGRGETSLRTNRVKNLLNLAMPMLGDGLERLADQADNGFRDQLRGAEPALSKAA